MQTNIRFCLNVAGLASQTHEIGLKAHSRQSPAGDDEASSSDEKCSAEVGDQEDPNVPEDEENGDGIMVPADIELQQNLLMRGSTMIAHRPRQAWRNTLEMCMP